MSEAPLMNDDQARSTTGEILDQATQSQTTTQTSTEKATGSDTATTQDSPAPSTETKDGTTTLTKPTEGEKPDAATTVPEKYEDFKAPEGLTLDPKAIEAAIPIFKELGLSQDAAQKLVTHQAQLMAEALKAPQTTYEQTRAGWQADVLNDPDIKSAASGGKTGIDAVKLDIGRALTTIGDTKLTSDFKAAMDLTGAGDHPAFIKTFWKLSQLITEGRHVAGTGPSPAGQRAPGSRPPSAAQAIYPNLPSASG